MQAAAEKFGRVTIFVHWVTAVAVVVAAAFGLTSVYADSTELTRAMTLYHQSLGTALFILVLFRAAWRVTHPAPPPLAGTPAFRRIGAAATHGLLYVMLIFLPLTGYIGLAARGREISIMGLFTLPNMVPVSRPLSVNAQDLHNYGQYVLYALVLLHVGGALYHHYILKDGLMRRMMTDGPLIKTPR